MSYYKDMNLGKNSQLIQKLKLNLIKFYVFVQLEGPKCTPQKNLIWSLTFCLVISQMKIEWMKWFTSTMDKITPMWMKKIENRNKKRTMCKTPRFGK